MLLIALTISEAAAVLGISTDASKAEINTAYRDAITKYHPDANRTKSPEEQKRAEQMFKQVGAARKVMLNPSTAEPEPADLNMSSASHQAQAQPPSSHNASSSFSPQQQASQARPRQSYRASASTSQYAPQGYNTSRNFNNDMPRVVDPAEEQIAEIYREETKENYVSFSDKARLTPSWAVSLTLLLMSLACFFLTPFSFDNVSFFNPCIIMALVCLVKIVSYDMFASYYIFRAIKKSIRTAWGVLCGAELLILGVVGAVLMSSSAFPPAIAVPMFAGAAAVGAIMVVLSVILSKAKKNGES